jgi:uncharacterized protein (DUF2147 family)
MKQRPTRLTAAAAAMTLFAAPAALAALEPTGVWINDTGRGAVEIKPCGNLLCGHVVWVKDTSDTKGCGKQIIGDVQSGGGGRWNNGWIYSPEKRKNYDVELTPLKNGTLQVVGYAGTKLFSRTMIWTRAAVDLQRCGLKETKVLEPKALEAKALEAQARAIEVPSAQPATTSSATAATAPAPAASPPASPLATPSPAPAAAAPSVAPTATAPASAKPEEPSVRAETAPTQSEPSTPSTADADPERSDDEGDEKPGDRSKGGGLKIGGIDLDKVLTRTQSGKCKLDLPWVKVQFDCDQ